eukprot:TRINITY_DN878_c0_g1_i1.p1 TRINITY_DN878_c0_g1~~TRINITY_DN878_c0_g1_i1.p1  ORF type:complete len:559 (-),score=107.67 TRINITY_DN878_c0_g1_i1:165-1841(-)
MPRRRIVGFSVLLTILGAASAQEDAPWEALIGGLSTSLPAVNVDAATAAAVDAANQVNANVDAATAAATDAANQVLGSVTSLAPSIPDFAKQAVQEAVAATTAVPTQMPEPAPVTTPTVPTQMPEPALVTTPTTQLPEPAPVTTPTVPTQMPEPAPVTTPAVATQMPEPAPVTTPAVVAAPTQPPPTEPPLTLGPTAAPTNVPEHTCLLPPCTDEHVTIGIQNLDFNMLAERNEVLGTLEETYAQVIATALMINVQTVRDMTGKFGRVSLSSGSTVVNAIVNTETASKAEILPKLQTPEFQKAMDEYTRAGLNSDLSPILGPMTFQSAVSEDLAWATTSQGPSTSLAYMSTSAPAAYAHFPTFAPTMPPTQGSDFSWMWWAIPLVLLAIGGLVACLYFMGRKPTRTSKARPASNSRPHTNEAQPLTNDMEVGFDNERRTRASAVPPPEPPRAGGFPAMPPLMTSPIPQQASGSSFVGARLAPQGLSWVPQVTTSAPMYSALPTQQTAIPLATPSPSIYMPNTAFAQNAAAQAAAMFDSLDRDGDGVISREELARAGFR